MSRSLRLVIGALPLCLACPSSSPDARPTQDGEAAPKAATGADAPSEKAPAAAPEAPPVPPKSPAQISEEVLSSIDPEADPCQDFYAYACGGWLEKTQLPGDKSRWTRSFSVLRENNRALAREILEAASKDPKASGERKKLGQFYAACMDEAAVESAGTAVLDPMMKQIDAIADTKGLMRTVGTFHRQGIRPFFGVYVGPDDKNPKRNIAHVGQGGLGLPDRDYYFDEGRKEILAAYRAHVAKNFELLGADPKAAKLRADAVVDFEAALAKHHLTRVDRRDPDKTYNKIDRAGIEKLAPKLQWAAYAEGTGHADVTEINVDNPPYLDALDDLIESTDDAVLKDYLRWKVVGRYADWLPKAFADEAFEFYSRTLRGTKEAEERWKKCASNTDRAFSHPMGRLYVERAFAGESKTIAKDLIARVEAAFEAILPSLEWMDDTTRERAKGKVAAIYNKIGYPDTWRSYEGLEVGDSLFANLQASANFEYEYRAAKYGKPVERDEWRAGPTVVNASYSGTRNEMWFPAGILQSPFFHKDHPMAMNFGAVGVVMGHELTHGFDDKGRKFDAEGMLQPWWEPPVIEAFESRTTCVDELYSRQEVEPGLTVNGKLTMGENIADMGGLKQAYRAYRTWAEENGGDTEPHIEGLTNDQLFFVSFAQVWCTKATPEYLRVQVATDPHSPGRFRANVPVSQSPDFAKAFACAEATPMNPKDRCEVW